ncbi:MAG: hypothetical protein QM714_15930 [Nocardioides sp.]|uniref:hypothetical protein n=1 Tax=Nocardioides sp. TaxID=35761 RepID=UPI0039E3FD61
MSTTTSPIATPKTPVAAVTPPDPVSADAQLTRISARFGLAFTICQLAVMIGMSIFVLPKGGTLGDTPTHWGHDVLDAETWYRAGNYAFVLAGTLLIGFLGAVHVKLRRADPSGALAAIGVGSGVLLALIWPYAAVLHDVALDVAMKGTDVRMLAGWDSIAPYSLAFSVLPRLFFIAVVVAALRLTGEAVWLQRIGIALLPVGLIATATLMFGGLFPILALSTLGYELWVGAVAWHWLRTSR